MKWSQIAAYAEVGFTNAAANFAEKPSADNWQLLLLAMLVHQQVRMCATAKRQEVIGLIMQVNMGQLDAALVQAISGQSMAELLK